MLIHGPHLLTQNPWGWGSEMCVLTSSPGNSVKSNNLRFPIGVRPQSALQLTASPKVIMIICLPYRVEVVS